MLASSLWNLFLLLCTPIVCVSADAAAIPSSEFVLIGSTSNLANKYLYSALFRNYFDENGTALDMNIFAAATKDAISGNEALHRSLDKTLSCEHLINGAYLSESECIKRRMLFTSKVRYVRLKEEHEYQQLGQMLSPHKTRIIYLSITPSLYDNVAARINMYLRPAESQNLRVVFEKPFGKDLNSATQLAQQLQQHLHEKEIYRVDHYLGKVGMKAIAAFRSANEPMIGAVITAVDVVMTETEHVAGRSGFYDEYGVIRDVMQNHLTLALVSAIMKTHNEISCVSCRVQTLANITDAEILMIGQYRNYQLHVREDTSVSSSVTPTAAVLQFKFRQDNYNFPIRMLAGKALSSRQMFVRVQMRSSGANSSDACNIVYNIHGDSRSGNLPYILLSGVCFTSLAEDNKCSDLPERISAPPGWVLSDPTRCACEYICMLLPNVSAPSTPLPYSNSYVEVLRGVLHNDASLFVSTEELLAQWQMFDSLLQQTQHENSLHRLVEYNSDFDILQFMVQ